MTIVIFQFVKLIRKNIAKRMIMKMILPQRELVAINSFQVLKNNSGTLQTARSEVFYFMKIKVKIL